MAEISLDVEVEGIEEAQERLEGIQERTTGEDLQQATEPGAEIVVGDARKHAPRRTGRLRRNILSAVMVLRKTYVEFGIGMSEEAFYGIFWELGWTDRAGNFHAPEPFLRPAIDSNKQIIVRTVRAEYRRNLLRDLI